VSFKAEMKRFVPLEEIKKHNILSGMKLLQKGNRLSILPVTREEFEFIVQLGN